MNGEGSALARWPLRLTGAVAALAAAALTLQLARADALDRRALVGRVAALGAGPDTVEALAERLAREADPGERRVAVARALLVRDFAAASPEPPAALAARLAAARELAGEALALLPASWEAALVAGAATFELRLAARDTRLFTAAREWEAPLAAAAARARGAPAVEQTLAHAYLEVWPALSPAKRPLAEELLRRSFRDPDFRQRRFARWLAIAGSPAAAEALLPADAESFGLLAGAAWSAGDAPAAAGYRTRRRAALHEALAERLEAALRAPGRLPRGLGAELADVVAAAPLGRDFAPLVERAARERPPGPARAELAQAAARWLAWAWPLCLVGDCPLAAPALDRLAAAAGSRLDGAEAALAALAAGDEARAELLARRSEALWSEAWAPYLLLAAKRRLAAGDVAAARALLAEVHRAQRARPAWRALRAAAGEPAELRLDARAEGPPWQPTAWRTELGSPALELDAPRPARALVVGFHRPAERAGLVEIEWDGEVLAPEVVRAGAAGLRLELDVAPGLHLVRLRPLAGGLPELGVTTLE